MLPPIPFLVHSLFAIGAWLLGGGVISCDRFLTIAGKAMVIHSRFNRPSVKDDECSQIRPRGPEQCMQNGFHGRTDGLWPYRSHFDEAGSWWVTENPTRHPKRFQHHKLQSNTHKSLLLSHPKLHTPQPNQCTKLLWEMLFENWKPLRIPLRGATYPLGWSKGKHLLKVKQSHRKGSPKLEHAWISFPTTQKPLASKLQNLKTCSVKFG